PGSGWGKGIPQTPEAAHAWVDWAHSNGVDGLKLGAERPDLMEIYCQDAKKLGMGTTAHLQQTGVVQVNAIKAARMGLGTVTHFYRPLRIAAEGLRRAAVSGDAELQQRAGSLQPGRAAVGQDLSAGLAGMESVPR